MLGQTLEDMKSKNVSQNSKIMFRTKITATSISHSSCFSQLLQKEAYNFGTNPHKRNQLHGLLDHTIMILRFRTDMPGKTVQTQIRLLQEEQSDQGLHYLPFRLHRLDSLLYGRAT